MMATSIKNKRAIVTGGANGLGNEYAHQLLVRGAKTVVILDMDMATGIEAIKKFNNQFGPHRAVFFPTDVSKPGEFEASFKKAVEYLGGLDILINNAGISDGSRWNLMIDINIKAVIQGTLMGIEVMGKHRSGNSGTIINIGSIASFISCQYIPVYAATKHAVIGFTRSIALNFEETGVAVKAMCPGATDTSMMTNKHQQFIECLDQESAIQWLQEWSLQKPEIVAKDVMRLIEEAPNGAIWVNTVNSPTMSLDIPEYTHWGTPVGSCDKNNS